MKLRLFIEAAFKIVIGFFAISLTLFLPAGTIYYPNAWIFMAVLFIPMLILGIIMFLKNPALLKHRLNSRENIDEEKFTVCVSAIMFVAGFVIAGLDFRFSWSNLSTELIIVSVIVFLASYVLYAEVIRENRYLSRIIETDENQKVIDSGLYSMVRHPMYSATIFMFLSTPMILGSVYALLIFAFYPFIICRRIKNEENFLDKNLEGYTEYRKRVLYKLLPYIW